MANQPLNSADASAPSAAPVKASVPLPEEMADWLSTQQAADLLGCSRRQFQDLTIRQKLPKRKVGLSAFYAPVVVEQARRAWQKSQADKAAPKPARAGKPVRAEKPPADTDAVPAAGDDAFYNQALALIGQIVQQRGRLRR